MRILQIENSIAEMSNLIKQHDRILSVNGVSLQNVSQQNAADIIKVNPLTWSTVFRFLEVWEFPKFCQLFFLNDSLQAEYTKVFPQRRINEMLMISEADRSDKIPDPEILISLGMQQDAGSLSHFSYLLQTCPHWIGLSWCSPHQYSHYLFLYC